MVPSLPMWHLVSTSIIAAPFSHCLKNRFQTPPQFGQGVLYPRRHFCVDLPINQAVLLHLSKLLGKHLLADTRDSAVQFPEAFYPGKELSYDKHLPFISNERKCCFNRTLGFLVCHGYPPNCF